MKILNTTNHHRNANQNYDETSPPHYLVIVAIYQKVRSVGKDVDQRESSCTLAGTESGVVIMENITEVPKKLKIGLPYDPAILLLDV